jgi:CRISPR/Cas system-associated endoribonuclease Cas2
MILLVAYDLHNPNRDYDEVIKTIKTASSWAHAQESVWLIDTTQSPEYWVKKLVVAGDTDDKLFVIQLKKNAEWRNLSESVAQWINNSARSW